MTPEINRLDQAKIHEAERWRRHPRVMGAYVGRGVATGFYIL